MAPTPPNPNVIKAPDPAIVPNPPSADPTKFADYNESAAHEIVQFILAITVMAKNAGVSLGKNWDSHSKDTEIVVKSTYAGDEQRFSSGLALTSTKTTTVDDKYIDFLKAVLNMPTLNTTTTEITTHTYSTGDDGLALTALPDTTIVEKYGPYIRTLDYTMCLINPVEQKPLFRLFNIVEGARGALAVILNIICGHIFSHYAFQDVWSFMITAHDDLGFGRLQKTLSKGGIVISDSFMTTMRNTKQVTSILSKVQSMVSSQFNNLNIDIDTANLAVAIGMPDSTHLDYTGLHDVKVAFDLIQQRTLKSRYTIFQNKLISFNKTQYHICGATTVVVTSNTALSDNGAMCNVNSKSQTVPSEQIIKRLSPLKRTVTYPTGGSLKSASNLYTHSRVQIPCSNWDDVRRVQTNCPTSITQGNASYMFNAKDLYEATNAFYSSINQSGIKTAKMSYDCTKGSGTFDVGYIRAT